MKRCGSLPHLKHPFPMEGKQQNYLKLYDVADGRCFINCIWSASINSHLTLLCYSQKLSKIYFCDIYMHSINIFTLISLW